MSWLPAAASVPVASIVWIGFHLPPNRPDWIFWSSARPSARPTLMMLLPSASPSESCGRPERAALIATELEALAREAATGADFASRIAALTEEKARIEAELAALNARWAEEKALVDRIAGLLPAALMGIDLDTYLAHAEAAQVALSQLAR